MSWSKDRGPVPQSYFEALARVLAERKDAQRREELVRENIARYLAVGHHLTDDQADIWAESSAGHRTPFITKGANNAVLDRP